MKWPKYLNEYANSTIADKLGVKPATVARWRSKKTIPKKWVSEIRSVKKIRVPPKTVRARILKNTPIKLLIELASLGGYDVSDATVRKWRREKDIPVNYRGFISDSYATPKQKKQKKAPAFSRTVKFKRGKHWRFYVATYWIDDELTDTLIGQVAEFFSKEKPPHGAIAQFNVRGTSKTKLSDYIDETGTTYEYSKEGGFVVDYWRPIFHKYSSSVSNLVQSLEDRKHFDILIESITMTMRLRK